MEGKNLPEGRTRCSQRTNMGDSPRSQKQKQPEGCQEFIPRLKMKQYIPKGFVNGVITSPSGTF